jgi:hypothetical protein
MSYIPFLVSLTMASDIAVYKYCLLGDEIVIPPSKFEKECYKFPLVLKHKTSSFNFHFLLKHVFDEDIIRDKI